MFSFICLMMFLSYLAGVFTHWWFIRASSVANSGRLAEADLNYICNQVEADIMEKLDEKKRLTGSGQKIIEVE